MHSDAFDVIPYEDLKGNWKKLGAGSFGNVYKANYLGIEVAIKEVLPSNDYDVGKYFEREWRLMKETRHPNVVLYLGLSRAPDPDGRIFIVSEFIDNGNLRNYIYDKHKPFPWRMRMSFATDIARALAYLHARRCIHRDLKGENLLVTANGRLKITDFGFARIAARNAEESRRLTFCGTDSYMSPEILLGHEFDLPTDVFSLGVIFAEIASRKLADDRTFKRAAPFFAIDEAEVRAAVSADCPPALVQLILDCVRTEPAQRPVTRDILERLGAIEAEVLARDQAGEPHVGSIKFITGSKRPGVAPRIPSFGMGIGKDIRSSAEKDHPFSSDDDSDGEELSEAISALRDVGLEPRVPQSESQRPLIDDMSSTYSDFSTQGHGAEGTDTIPPSMSSIMTIRPSPSPNVTVDPMTAAGHAAEPTATASGMSVASYTTAASSLSSTAATEGGSMHVSPSALVHRFTLIQKRRGASSAEAGAGGGSSVEGWSPFDFFFSGGSGRCDICQKRLGWKPALECDDCGLRAHLKCGELAPHDCGLRLPKVHALPAAEQSAKGKPALNGRKVSK